MLMQSSFFQFSEGRLSMILAKYIKIGDKVAHQDLIAIGEILDIYESSGWVAVEILWDRHVQGKYVLLN